MNPHMTFQIKGLGETFCTHLTFERHSTCMDAHVAIKFASLGGTCFNYVNIAVFRKGCHRFIKLLCEVVELFVDSHIITVVLLYIEMV